MSKRFIGLFIALVLVLAAVPSLAEDKTTVTYWVNDRHDSEYMTKMIDEYNASNTDGILIDMQIITDDYENMIALAYTSGDSPDIIGQSVTLKNFVDNGMLVPLNDYIDADETYKKVNEPYEHAYEGLNYMGGKIYWVYTGMRSGVRVEYNKDLLAKNGYTELPTNLKDYIDMAKALTTAGAGGGQTFFRITLPMLSPVMKVILLLAVTGAFKDYEAIMVLTSGGGPGNRANVMFLYIYNIIFGTKNSSSMQAQIGYGALLSVVAAVIVGAVTGIYLLVSKKLDDVV